MRQDNVSLFNDLFEMPLTAVGSGLVLVEETYSTDMDGGRLLCVYEAEKFGAAAVYVRGFFSEEEKEYIRYAPQVYIFEKESLEKDATAHQLDYDTYLVELHKRLWSAGIIEVYIIVSDEGLVIRSGREPVTIAGDTNKLPMAIIDESLEIVGEYQKQAYLRFSGRLFDKGLFLEQEDCPVKIKDKDTPFFKLLEGLKAVRTGLLEESGIPRENKKPAQIDPRYKVVNRLLLLSLLIRYLEEQKDNNGNGVFRAGFFKEAAQSIQEDNFSCALRNNRALEVFNACATHFEGNGHLFEWNDEKEIRILGELKGWSNLANYLSGNVHLETKQATFGFMRYFSFADLPVELISCIYELFLPEKSGVVYTPPFLVEFLVDECMPLKKSKELFANERFRVLDPSCGSGIFLVGAYRRMLQWWALNNRDQHTGRPSSPSAATRKAILRNNIFGVDIEEEAINLGFFSLCVSLCDGLEPTRIWEDLRFEDLTQTGNLIESDFFGQLSKFDTPFDLIIGNPPFNPNEGNNGAFLKTAKAKGVIPSHKLPFDNLAMFFLDQSLFAMIKGTEFSLAKKVCLIIPSGPLLYNEDSVGYRPYLFENRQVTKIYDFTRLQSNLFHGVTEVSTCAIIAENTPPIPKTFLQHITIKRTINAEKRLAFELDYYDFHKIRRSNIDADFPWKANLYGGGRLARLVNYWKSLRTIKEFVNKENWKHANGYKIGTPPKNPEIIEYLYEKEEIDKVTLNGYSTKIITQKTFEAPRKEEIYKAPLLLLSLSLKENSLWYTFLKYGEIRYNKRFSGIITNDKDLSKLADLKGYFDKNSNVINCFLFSTSIELQISRVSTILKADIDRLPYPEDPETALYLSVQEEMIVDDMLEYWIHENKSPTEDYGKKLNSSVGEEQLQHFGKVFCDNLNPLYANEQHQWNTLKLLEGPDYIYVEFGFGKKNLTDCPALEVGEISDELQEKIENNLQHSFRVKRIVRAYLHEDGYDKLCFIKPKQTRYWLNSVALRDADDTFAHLKKQGF